MQYTPSDRKHLAALVQGIQFAMLATVSEENETIRSRPMTLLDTDLEGVFWFFTSRSCSLAGDIGKNPNVNLAFANPHDNSYVSVGGVAELVHNPEKAKELWTPAMKAWFPKGLDDPDLALLRVQAEWADYWESPSAKVVQLYGFAKAMITGKRRGSEAGSRGHLEI